MSRQTVSERRWWPSRALVGSDCSTSPLFRVDPRISRRSAVHELTIERIAAAVTLLPMGELNLPNTDVGWSYRMLATTRKVKLRMSKVFK